MPHKLLLRIVSYDGMLVLYKSVIAPVKLEIPLMIMPYWTIITEFRRIKNILSGISLFFQPVNKNISYLCLRY